MTRIHHSIWRLLAFLYCPFAFSGFASEPPAVIEAPSIYDRIWKQAELYNNPENRFFQRVALTGRYQLDYAMLDRDDFDRLTTRRWRLGTRIRFLDEFTFHTEADLHPDEPSWYRGITDASISWSPAKTFTLVAGKQSVRFTVDGTTSSRELLAIDRSNLSINLWGPQETIPGISVLGEVENWIYQLGIFTLGSANKEFGNFDGGYFILSTAGYDFASAWNVKQALLAANYVFQDARRGINFLHPLEHIGSVNFQFESAKWGFRSDVSAAKGGFGQSDLWGAMVMPFYNLTAKLQTVGRYTYVSSAEDNGVRFARYENLVVPGRGDEYQEIYGGLNYYFYGHKLKIQTGVHYAMMHDAANDGGQHRGWGWTTGLRVSW